MLLMMILVLVICVKMLNSYMQLVMILMVFACMKGVGVYVDDLFLVVNSYMLKGDVIGDVCMYVKCW